MTFHAPVRARPVRRLLPGLAIAAVIGCLATGIGRLLPVVGAPVIAIALGALAGRWARGAGWAVAAGSRLAGRYVLQAAIVVFGAGLSLTSVLRVGVASLPVMLGTLAACGVMALVAGRLLRVDDDLRLLIGAGTGICGASAIGAVAPVIGAGEAAVGYAMSTIFVFNVAAVIVFPVVGHLLGLSAHGFGLWAGTAINDTSSVTAAGYAYGPAAGDYAIVVKLCRSLMIIPVVLAVSVLRHRRGTAGTHAAGRPPVRRLVPPFLLLFLLAALANTVGAVPHDAHAALGFTATLGVAVAMAGVGLDLRLAELRRAGVRPLLLGVVLSVTVALTGLGLQAVTGR
ncbi:putative sulfate exporter family transporter [Planosporangium thailandense]|uniref:Sulfate exporter family transporter n=2 Tax=Planosporangium thailandense TaxID=765197 RepID=A0ABX0Y424_9ACTN|nr:putative sulfate exporter family transporter [Planosporangium thailandense]NJC73146.1 putative sulfate exporter family transporter [Planosporangium thailandense]